MKFFALLVWVLTLSWLTHAAASPSWRAPNIVEEFLSATQAANLSEWEVKPASTVMVAAPGPSIVLNPDTNKWGRAIRLVPVTPTENLYRLKITLTTDTLPAQRFTLFPEPVFHFHVNTGTQKYPFVERPMFFRSEVRIDEVIELTGEHSEVELSFITTKNSIWRLSNLSLSAVREHGRYNTSFSALIGLWGLTLLWGVLKAWRRSRLPTLAVGGLLAVVLIGVLASRIQVMQVFGLLSTGIRSVGGQLSAGNFSTFMQAGHIGLFCVLTFAALVFRRKWYLTYTRIVLGALVLAIATEALQRHAFGRSPDVQDFIFDILGIVVGSILYELSNRIVNAVRRRPKLS